MSQTPSPSPDENSEVSFDELIAALLDQSNPFPARYLYRLSNLDGPDLETFTAAWPQVSLERRRRLLEDLEVFVETDLLVSIEAVCKVGMADPDPEVRLIALRAMWESDDPAMGLFLLSIFENDSSTRVRAQAAASLGPYIYLGELEIIDSSIYSPIVDQLLAVMETGEDARIRRSALESLGYSSHARIANLIEEAYGTGDEDWLASALLAMGRSADSQWHPMVVNNLTHSDSKVRLEACQAAGALAIPEAVPILLELIDDEDDEVRMAAIWSLSEIGGDDVQDALEQLLGEVEDEDEIDIIEDALENLFFTQDYQDFNILSFSEDDLDDLINMPPDEE